MALEILFVERVLLEEEEETASVEAAQRGCLLATELTSRRAMGKVPQILWYSATISWAVFTLGSRT